VAFCCRGKSRGETSAAELFSATAVKDLAILLDFTESYIILSLKNNP
jgi:hypothetical protein